MLVRDSTKNSQEMTRKFTQMQLEALKEQGYWGAAIQATILLSSRMLWDQLGIAAIGAMVYLLAHLAVDTIATLVTSGDEIAAQCSTARWIIDICVGICFVGGFIFSKIISAKDENSANRLSNSLHEQGTIVQSSQVVSDMNKTQKSRLSVDDVIDIIVGCIFCLFVILQHIMILKILQHILEKDTLHDLNIGAVSSLDTILLFPLII